MAQLGSSADLDQASMILTGVICRSAVIWWVVWGLAGLGWPHSHV